MVEIIEVKTRKEQKRFIQFPIELYKDSPYYVPVLTIDEKKIFKKDYVYNETCDVVFYNAYKEGKLVGRISGIIQRASNEKWGQSRIRFTRFDAIDDQEVANALFDAVINFAKEHQIKEIVGPLGYSDLEREGLLIEGFDELGTYEEQYNYPYYQKLIENYGFVKEVDWTECKFYLPKVKDERLYSLSQKMMDRYGLKLWYPKSINWFLKNYLDQFFDIIDETYDHIYGTVPFTDKMKKVMVSNFRLLARNKDIGLITNKDGKLVGFALMFPSISKIVRDSKGRITLPFLIRFLKVKKHPEVLDLGLIGVLKEYESKGIASAMIAALQDIMRETNPEHLETNLMLENNYRIQNLTKNWDKVQNKRRRCFIKQIQND